jgi:hypothetical protein
MAHRRKRKSNTDDSTALAIVLLGGVASLPAIVARAYGVPWPAIIAGYFCIVATAAWRLMPVSRRQAPPKAPPTTTAIHIAPLNKRLLLHYADREGHETDRLITLRAMDGDMLAGTFFQAKRLQAYCHTRKAARTFLVPHITHMADGDTGEVIKDVPAYLHSLAAH